MNSAGLQRPVLAVVGTRPEAIKMAPVLRALDAADLPRRLCVTGQHRQMLDPILALWDLEADHDLGVMEPAQGLPDLTARLLTGLGRVLERERPSSVLVQGDTTSAFAGALAAFYAGIPVGHVEAGLRTGDLAKPFPEEANRRMIDALSTWCFAPTEGSRRALAGEGRVRGVHVTGNTVVDALLDLRRRLGGLPLERHRGRLGGAWGAVADGDTTVVLVTCHRRESFGPKLEGICRAVRRLAEARPSTAWVFPVHLNPAVRRPAGALLRGLDNLHLIEPLPYDLCVQLMMRASLILTDSGGIQEEAPSLGTPVAVLRDVTERPEGIDAGVATLVGTEEEGIHREVGRLLDAPEALGRMVAASNPYGDGLAAERIVGIVAEASGGG
ncbi:MAG: UDP-N-acetylglucosamine 2-epimerase (non-hydrolyzing) [Acidobacteriota bacterium]